MGIRILIIDDHPEYRTWLGHHLTAEWADAEIIGHDPSAGRLLPDGLSPSDCDLILLDHTWPGGSGLDVLGDLKRRSGCPPVILMTPQGDKDAIAEAFKAGADDFLPKAKVSHEHLVMLVRETLRRQAAAVLERPAAQYQTSPAGAFTLKGHDFVRLLARGGVSSVYLMQRSDDRRPVVVKVLTEVPDVAEGKNDFERFLQEYELISAIRHRNVVQIYDLGIADDHAYIAMEYFPEGHLGQRIGSGLAVDVAVGYLEQMARALMAIHAVGVLHRDLKPGNVMLRIDDSLALIDFGLAKQLRTAADITHTGEIFGTPYYMSPEQGHGDPVDERGDIYSLGIMFYEMLTGSKPYLGASPMAVIYKHSHSDIPALPANATHLQGLLEGMMAKDPSERFQSADDLLAAIVAAREAA